MATCGSGDIARDRTLRDMRAIEFVNANARMCGDLVAHADGQKEWWAMTTTAAKPVSALGAWFAHETNGNHCVEVNGNSYARCELRRENSPIASKSASEPLRKGKSSVRNQNEIVRGRSFCSGVRKATCRRWATRSPLGQRNPVPKRAHARGVRAYGREPSDQRDKQINGVRGPLMLAPRRRIEGAQTDGYKIDTTLSRKALGFAKARSKCLRMQG